MEHVGSILTKMMEGLDEPVRTIFEQAAKDLETMTPDEILQKHIDHYNNLEGELNGDGAYDCRVCRNKGWIAVAENGREALRECRCMPSRRSIWRMQASGLASTIRRYRFGNFTVTEDWQKKMYDTAKAYVEKGMGEGAWFYIGGAVGCGKSHICTAMVREALGKGRAALYISWPQEATKIKASITDDNEYENRIRSLKEIELLYIDDFFKPVNGMKPTGADVRLAYEILNFRYVNKKPTIISSELYLDEIEDVDEAVGSRIYEMAKDYRLMIKRDPSRNQRKAQTEII